MYHKCFTKGHKTAVHDCRKNDDNAPNVAKVQK